VGECFFWYWPTRVVPDKGPLNGCVYVCVWNLFNSTESREDLNIDNDHTCVEIKQHSGSRTKTESKAGRRIPLPRCKHTHTHTQMDGQPKNIIPLGLIYRTDNGIKQQCSVME